MKLGKAEIVIIISGILIAVYPVMLVVFLWGESLNTAIGINYEKFGTFGDVLSGTIGPIWSFAGILLFYFALKDQRKDFATNKIALQKQSDALNLQLEEFRLQREEQSYSRKVASEQAKTLLQQRIESTYFSLLDLYYRIVTDLNATRGGKSYFNFLKTNFVVNYEKAIYKKSLTPLQRHLLAIETYEKLFHNHLENDLSHYYRIVYRIIKIIDASELGEIEKFQYIKILRSRLSQNEILFLYYNSFVSESGEFYKLILRYNLLKHLSPLAKMEFRNFNGHKDDLLVFISEIQKRLPSFFEELRMNIFDDIFESEKASFKIRTKTPLVVALESSDLSSLEVNVSRDDGGIIEGCLGMTEEQATVFFEQYFYDLFVLSQYNERVESQTVIKVSTTQKEVKIVIAASSNLTIMFDQN